MVGTLLALVLLAPPRDATAGATCPPAPIVSLRTLEQALALARTNADALRSALAAVEPESRDDLEWLVRTMPPGDLAALKPEFLLRNVRLAHRARDGSPWGRDLPPELFRQYVLPYASLNERRDDWRQDFVDRFAAGAWKFTDPIDAVRWINDRLMADCKVGFDWTKRIKTEQSPYETMQVGWGSCTAMSILLVDACRAAGIPARIVGIPAWTQATGNHTWVEVWWDRWHIVPEAGKDPRQPDWVREQCRTQARADDWVHAVYAATWRPTGTHFPMCWAFEIEWVPALNITRLLNEEVAYRALVPGGGPTIVEARWHGDLIARARAGADGTATLPLARGETFELTFVRPDGSRSATTVTP
jgi:hypothetical protein